MDDREIPRLEAAIDHIWDVARSLGLDPFPVHFEIVPATIMYEFGAYLLPGRFRHWTHGKAYYQMKTLYDYGLSKIYELVINSDPCYAFLLDTNSLLHNKFVVAHVLGHSDFFKHNVYFSRTDRAMLDLVGEHARRIRRYAQDHGEAVVEGFLDAALAIAEHVDPYPQRTGAATSPAGASGDGLAPGRAPGPYADLFPHAPSGKSDSPPGRRSVPPEPEADLLRFFLTHADHLTEWQQDILDILRLEGLYFWPQTQTKIMNEGWASFWHNRILRDLELDDAEYTEYSRLHAAVCSPGGLRINPYHVGLSLFNDIERRFGLEQVFAARDVECDVSFIRFYLTEELCEQLDLFVYDLDDTEWKVASRNWEDVRDGLIRWLGNGGRPHITVEDGDYRGARELFLRHRYDGRQLDIPFAEQTLRHIHTLWQRPVHLETALAGDTIILTHDGSAVEKRVL